MGKQTVNSTTRQPLNGGLGGGRPHQRIRIGFSDLEPLWNAEDEKYKVFCRSVHVSKAALYVSYVQLVASFMFSIFFAYNYMMIASVQTPSADSWVETFNNRYMSQLMMAVTLHVLLLVVLIHGIKTARKSLLMPYIVYAAITVLTGLVGVVNDIFYLDSHIMQDGGTNSMVRSQLRRHLFGTIVQAWFLSIIWRCYGYLGDKKVARQIRDQMCSTASAFRYPENLMCSGYALMQQPPPYVDTVMSPSATIPPPVYIGPIGSGIEKPITKSPGRIITTTTELATEAKEEGEK
ncbi:hypothetical protein ACQ4LE_000718 [Meloidogyne hapla]|uniref:Uncharacterized protein n=1 Tax=Meloidogyne hapla TaxID=6305 RepID=A0A1I8BXI2_MELHA